ncbi:MAG: multicopper oxidase domain-containing protein [Phaeodactylibacter sp.]|nr:multicopper oxidase domain-containing protein [Phaeodactylibacter sp.]
MNFTNNRRPFYLALWLAAFLFAPWGSHAQVALLDAASHPKFVTGLPNPAKINATNGGYFAMEMREVIQHLGLYKNGVASPANKLYTSVWGYGPQGGSVTYPGPTFMAMEDEDIYVKWENQLPNQHLLPVDQTLHWASPPGYPRNGQPAVVHLHGGHTESASDGLPEAWYTRRWRDRGPTYVKKIYHYDNDQEAATLWYHDHALGITRLNVYAGLAGFYLLRDDNELNLIGNGVLPGGEYEREVVVQDRLFTSDGDLWLPSKTGDPWFGNGFGTDPNGEPLNVGTTNPSVVAEFFGNIMIVNGVAWPQLDVKKTKYRIRLLNGSDSRFYVFYLEKQGAEGVKIPFMQIGTDNGLLPNPVPLDELVLAPGERADLVLNFDLAQLSPGDRVIMKNRGPDEPFRGLNPDGSLNDGGGGQLDEADAATTGLIMAFDVVSGSAPAFSVTTASTLRAPIEELVQTGPTRRVAFFEGMDSEGRLQPLLGIINGDNAKTPGTLNGSLAWFEPITENPMLDDVEVWEAYNVTEDAHPMHIHLVSFQILDRSPLDVDNIIINNQPQAEHHTAHTGKFGVGNYIVESSLLGNVGAPEEPAPNEKGWKDTFILPPGYMARVIAKYDRPGRYVWHCHILSHEDHEMMRPYEVVTSLPRPTPPTVRDFDIAEAILSPSFPNPSAGNTTIPFYLPKDDNILLNILDMDGKVVKQLAFGQYPAGNHTIEWDGTNAAGTPVPGGVYIYQLHTSDNVLGQQTIIQR